MRSSMDWPFSRRFSISISSFKPRSALETSKTPPTAAVSTPPVNQQALPFDPLSKFARVGICTFASPVQKRLKTSFMFPPFSMEMTRI
uniref:Uncharacterized protein n=1 Tax=Callorhinchus milii TaxID=7868 RepID=A0A4W3IXX9_CALMI